MNISQHTLYIYIYIRGKIYSIIDYFSLYLYQVDGGILLICERRKAETEACAEQWQTADVNMCFHGNASMIFKMLKYPHVNLGVKFKKHV